MTAVGNTPRSLMASVVLLASMLGACGGVPADASGPDIYSLSCARCHGSQLEGGVGPPLGPGSNSAAQSDEYLITTISRGLGRMPSFSGSLTEPQIMSVVRFIRHEQAG
jgi:mono/diheme cytochrome c family protein